MALPEGAKMSDIASSDLESCMQMFAQKHTTRSPHMDHCAVRQVGVGVRHKKPSCQAILAACPPSEAAHLTSSRCGMDKVQAGEEMVAEASNISLDSVGTLEDSHSTSRHATCEHRCGAPNKDSLKAGSLELCKETSHGSSQFGEHAHRPFSADCAFLVQGPPVKESSPVARDGQAFLAVKPCQDSSQRCISAAERQSGPSSRRRRGGLLRPKSAPISRQHVALPSTTATIQMHGFKHGSISSGSMQVSRLYVAPGLANYKACNRSLHLSGSTTRSAELVNASSRVRQSGNSKSQTLSLKGLDARMRL
jgi:hypothetical protein